MRGKDEVQLFAEPNKGVDSTEVVLALNGSDSRPQHRVKPRKIVGTRERIGCYSIVSTRCISQTRDFVGWYRVHPLRLFSHQQGDFLALFQDVVAKSVSESEGGQALDKADANHRRRSAQSAGPVTSFAQGKLKRDPLPAGDDADDAHEDSTSVAQGKGSGEAKGNGKPKAEFENIGGPLAEAKV